MKNTKRAPLALSIPALSSSDGMDIVSINSNLLAILRKKKAADFTMYGLPTQGDDVFSRKIRLVKMLKKDALGPIHDIPDLDDIHYTNLPWMGQSTFNAATRQFRSKNVLACVVEIVREIGGYLYKLSVASLDDRLTPAPPALVYLDRASPLERSHTLTVDKEITEQEREYYLANAPRVPMELVKEMHAIGYRCCDNIFILDGQPHPGADIRCELFGKVLLAS